MMKKILLTILLVGTMLMSVWSNTALAENFTYKVYNPKENKSVTAELGTLRVSDNKYMLGFFVKGQPHCIVNMNTEKKDGLICGKCAEYNSSITYVNGKSNSVIEFPWREISKNTFFPEVDSIVKERAVDNMWLMIVED